MFGTFSNTFRLKWKCIVVILYHQALVNASQQSSSTCAALIPGFAPSHVLHSKSRLSSLSKSILKRAHSDGDRIRTFANVDNGDNVSNEEAFKELKISFVTGNRMKAKEVNMILANHWVTKGPTPDKSIVNLRVLEVDLPEIQEVSTEAIAKNKAIQGAQLANGPCVVEDTSLEFTALGGMPGPYIKWFQQKLKSEGLYNLLLAYEDKSAVAVCTLAFCPYPHADPVLFTGRTHGKIVAPQPGRGFGWDSIFVPDDGNGEPFSLMPTVEKNKLSHRGEAVTKWANWLGVNQQELWERQEGKPAKGHEGLDFKNLAFSEDFRREGSPSFNETDDISQ